jgi:Dyp-type peroxidase family
MPRIEVEDVQGIVLRVYSELPHLAFVLLTAPNRDTAPARRWLATLLPQVTSAAQAPRRCAVNVAFTHPGLAVFGVPADTLGGLSRHFRDDVVADEHRNRTLGDEDDSRPERWVWGGPPQDSRPAVHVALLLYAQDETTLKRLHEQHEELFKEAGLQVVSTITTVPLPGDKEHFGFRDGISQPRIENDNPPDERGEALEAGTPDNTVKAGEFLYGYEDELGEVPPSPHVPPKLDPLRRLRPDDTGHDFGRNGTYLVARQLSQKVPEFWKFIFGKAELYGEDPVRLAAKMVGRWPNGAPLVLAPHEPLQGLEKQADFGYAGEGDSQGYKCPLGSHIRRANPRDALIHQDKAASIEIVKRHRLIRRGRPYGEPVHPSMEPCNMLESPARDGERGLLFLAFNVHFDRQFEFVQQNWLNNPKFGDLYTDADPIAGKIDESSTFTQQRAPLRLRIGGLQSFVQVRGSGYFFMPGLQALRWLTDGVQPYRAEIPRLPIDGHVEEPPTEQPPQHVTGEAGS